MTKLVNLVALVWKSCDKPILAFLAQRYTDGNKMGMQPVPTTLPTSTFVRSAADPVWMKFACNTVRAGSTNYNAQICLVHVK